MEVTSVKFKQLVRSLRAAMIQSAALALLLDKIKTFSQCYKTFLMLEQAWARLKSRPLCSAQLSRAVIIFFCSGQISYCSSFALMLPFQMRTAYNTESFIQLIIFSFRADHFISKVKAGEES